MDAKWTNAGSVLGLKSDIKLLGLNFADTSASATPEAGQGWFETDTKAIGWYNSDSTWFSNIKTNELATSSSALRAALWGYASRRSGAIQYSDDDTVLIPGNCLEVDGKLCWWDVEITFNLGSGGSNAGSTNLGANQWHYIYVDYSSITVTIPSTELVAANFINSTTRPWNSFLTGAADGTSANHLIDSGETFSAVRVGDQVHNTTDNTYANVTVVASGDLTLDADIFVSGEDYDLCHNPYNNAKQGYYNGSDRLIGVVLTDGSNHILKFSWDVNDLLYRFSVPIQELGGVGNTSYTDVDLTSSIPALGQMTAIMEWLVYGAGASNNLTFYIRPNGSAETATRYGIVPVDTSLYLGGQAEEKTDFAQKIEYQTASADADLSLNIQGFYLYI
ncbi:MAG: hypothetical protein A3K77_00465 [Euryarchaeota archaeon RBG_13_31_8]|nr:MAG: hypothetical protein A3K77_00465 [Euryarchaeota archaeon RBG_13_31_8]